MKSISSFTRCVMVLMCIFLLGACAATPPPQTSITPTQSGARIRFRFLDEDPTFSPVLDPHHPDHPGSVIGLDWAEWGSGLFVPAAGCYYLEAQWPGGHWRVTFAAGHE